MASNNKQPLAKTKLISAERLREYLQNVIGGLQRELDSAAHTTCVLQAKIEAFRDMQDVLDKHAAASQATLEMRE